jgi:hypothetical protein
MCACVCMCVCIHIYLYINTRTHTHTHTFNSRQRVHLAHSICLEDVLLLLLLLNKALMYACVFVCVYISHTLYLTQPYMQRTPSSSSHPPIHCNPLTPTPSVVLGAMRCEGLTLLIVNKLLSLNLSSAGALSQGLFPLCSHPFLFQGLFPTWALWLLCRNVGVAAAGAGGALSSNP